MGDSGAARRLTLARAVADRGLNSGASDRVVRTLTRSAGVAGALVSLSGIGVVAGWWLGLPGLTHLPGLPAMKLSTALCLVGLGLAIALSAHAELTGSARTRRLSLVVAALVGLAGVAVLVEDAFGLTSPLDNPFGLDPGDAHTLVPGRMAEMTAASLLAYAVALALAARRLDKTGHAVTLLVLTVASPVVVGYEYGVRTPYGLGPANTMEVQTGAAVVLAGCAILFLRPGAGILSLLVGDSAGAVLTRVLLPWVCFGPNLIGAVVVIGLRHRGYSGPYSLAIVVTVLTIAGTVLIWFLGERLREIDLRRGGAEDALAVAEQALAERDRVQNELAISVRRTRRILATAADAYIAIDTSGRVTDWNAAAAATFGWSREEAVGRGLEDLIIPPQHAAAHQAGITRYLQSGEAPILGRQLELEALNRAGTVIPVELTVWADHDDTVEGFHAFVRDITARKQAEEDLRRLNADLTEFAAVAAHDLRSPLTTIQMQVDLVLAELEAGWDPEETREWVDRIGRTAYRGVSLIDDLLAYVSVGRDASAPRPVQLDTLVRDVADAQLGASGRQAICSFEALPVVAGDEALVRQLVANLVGNAIKYVPADRTPEVVVDAVLVPGEDRCVLRVTDNGDGFHPDERERVFEMFQRGSGSAGVPGTGIGLAICRRVAERHGGRIWIEPAPTGGSRICVELPVWSAALRDAGRWEDEQDGRREPRDPAAVQD
jgi:PAS domain S-box-containing protein